MLPPSVLTELGDTPGESQIPGALHGQTVQVAIQQMMYPCQTQSPNFSSDVLISLTAVLPGGSRVHSQSRTWGGSV